MLLRGGRRVALVEGAVVALEVAGDGVEAGGEEDALALEATPEGSDDSVNNDMMADPKMRWNGVRDIPSSGREFVFRSEKCFFGGFAYSNLPNEKSMRDDPADKWRCGCRR